LWGLRGSAAPILDANRTVFLVALLENDNADASQVAQRVKAQITAGIQGLWLNALGHPA
jgi:GGDEF domain-containing protein